MDTITRVLVYETTSADPSCADAELQAQGRSMREAMVADLMDIDGVAVSVAVGGSASRDEVAGGADGSRLRGAPAAALRARPCRVAPGETPVEFLRRHAMLHDLVWVVAPESEGVLAALRGVVGDGQWLGCSAAAIAVAASKRATSSHLRAAGIAATESLQPGDRPAAHRHHGDWIVKPDDGCGAAGARRHPDAASAWADCSGRLQRGEDVVMEPWVEGEPLSLSLMCGETDVDLLAVNRQRIAFDASGQLHFQGVAPYASNARTGAMASLAGRIKEALPGLRGYVGIDVTWHPERGPVVIEINPRVTCAYPGLSHRTGFNVAQRMLCLHRRAHAVPRVAG